jgi:hypothetical protein
MVFSLASNFEFSTASMSTTCPWSGGAPAALSGAADALDLARFPTAVGGEALS